MEVDTPDAWGEVGQRYRHDERAQFVLFVEQFGEAASMVRSAEIVRQRMALVLIDNLAEMILHRQLRRSQQIGEESWANDVPRLGGTRLEKFKREFKARVNFARKGTNDPWLARFYRPLLTDRDAAIFRVAHAYRNRVYHADHHNPTVLPLLSRAYLGAVGAAFVRFQPTGTGSSPGGMGDTLQQYGFTGKGPLGSEGWYSPAEAAEEVVDHLVSGLDTQLAEARKTLVADLEWRIAWAREMVATLEREGLSGARIEDGLHWAEFWEQVGSRDQQITDLANEVSRLALEGREDDEVEEIWKRQAEAGQTRADRAFSLYAEFKPSIGLDDLGRAAELGANLRTARSTEGLFSRYRKLDESFEVIERHLDDMAIGWDRHLQHEEDVARGR